jgi:hypothetical protein
MSGYGKPTTNTARAISFAKLMPSLILPPITLNKIAPVFNELASEE